jgi:hypothetical protein
MIVFGFSFFVFGIVLMSQLETKNEKPKTKNGL